MASFFESRQVLQNGDELDEWNTYNIGILWMVHIMNYSTLHKNNQFRIFHYLWVGIRIIFQLLFMLIDYCGFRMSLWRLTMRIMITSFSSSTPTWNIPWTATRNFPLTVPLWTDPRSLTFCMSLKCMVCIQHPGRKEYDLFIRFMVGFRLEHQSNHSLGFEKPFSRLVQREMDCDWK